MEKILVTGGQGFLGSRFKKMWDKDYCILTPGVHELDVTNKDLVNEYIKRERPHYIIHAAGIPSQQFCIEHPKQAEAVNVDGALYVAQACREVKAKMIFISTEQVFNGSHEAGPYTENSKPCANTVYGQNKLDVEEILPRILEEYWIVRFTWLFGLPEKDCQMGSNILWDTIHSLIKHEPIKVTKYEFRGMSDVHEICYNLVQLFEKPYGTYHFGSTNNESRYDIVKLIMQELGVKEEMIKDMLIEDNSHYSQDNIRDLRLDTTKASQLGIYFTPTRESIKNCLKEFSIKE